MTLGQNHTHKVNEMTIDKDCVVVIKAETHAEMRQIAFGITDGGKFYTTYDDMPDMDYFPRGLIEIN